MKTAVMFPGQGSQSVGMLAAHAEQATVRRVFDECSEATQVDLLKLSLQGPEEQLNLTENTQPALLAASIALYRLWTEAGHSADMVAGHSLGEYSALVAAGALDLGAAARLVQLRGQFMQRAVAAGEGGMAAVLGLDDGQIESCCRQTVNASGGTVEPANYNAPGQVVIAGDKEAVQAAGAACKESGAKRVLPLAVSVPSHCSLMSGAAEQLAGELRQVRWSPVQMPLVQNVSAKPVTDLEQVVANLILQLHQPVRWSQSVRQLVALGAELLVECGPKQVLMGLARKIDGDVATSHAEKMLAAQDE